MSARPETVLSRLKNRLQQNERSFDADCMAVFTYYNRLYNGKGNKPVKLCYQVKGTNNYRNGSKDCDA